MRILISSYSFGAGHGSEAGVGWNVASGLALRGHEVWALSTSEFHADNLPAMEALNLPSFHLLEWDCGVVDFPKASSYRAWQKGVMPQLRHLCERECFDLVHHLTFNQYRFIHEVFATGLPFVLGPLGGAEAIHPALLRELPFQAAVKELFRYSKLDAYPLAARVRSHGAAGLILASGPQTKRRLESVGLRDVRLEPIIALREDEIVSGLPAALDSSIAGSSAGFSIEDVSFSSVIASSDSSDSSASSDSENPVSPADATGAGDYFIYAGGLRPEKAPYLMLRALAELWRQGCCVPLKMAAVPESEYGAVRARMHTLGLPEGAVELLPFMPRGELMGLMRGARAFLCFNVRDSGCMALLEAVAQGIPSICFDNEEQFWLPEDFAYKIPVCAATLLSDMAGAMRKCVESPLPDAAWHERRVAWLRGSMTWDARLDHLEAFYADLLGHKHAVAID